MAKMRSSQFSAQVGTMIKPESKSFQNLLFLIDNENAFQLVRKQTIQVHRSGENHFSSPVTDLNFKEPR